MYKHFLKQIFLNIWLNFCSKLSLLESWRRMGNKFSHIILTLFYKVYNLYIAYFCRFEKKMCAFECIYIHVYAIYMYIVCQNFWTFVWARSLYLFLEIMQVKINDNVKKKNQFLRNPRELTLGFPDNSISRPILYKHPRNLRHPFEFYISYATSCLCFLIYRTPTYVKVVYIIHGICIICLMFYAL